ncbi:hypothetical protein [Mycobacterium sp. IS-3022]|uniref:hypothetical protein n=1 Tax=Mycobacterium sp. IS-3022 TaxID=1772277 RepID=UPI0009EC06C7|nr:hypothetical protein [Mycobacterium sp. IS-3022]
MNVDEGAHLKATDAEVLRESGVHKLVITDSDGRCLAYLLAWASFGYDQQTDTYVCVADRVDGELITLFTDGNVTAVPGTNRYTVTAQAHAHGTSNGFRPN